MSLNSFSSSSSWSEVKLVRLLLCFILQHSPDDADDVDDEDAAADDDDGSSWICCTFSIHISACMGVT